jgi:ABC-type Na+ efflux pump permease subunit
MSVFVTLWRYRVERSIHRVGSLAIPAFSLILLCAARGMMGSPPGRAFSLLGFVVAGVLGSIGSEASSGRLPLMLTHPVSRSTYVLSHWAAAATIASAWALLALGGEWAVLASQGRGVFAPWAHVVDRVVWCAGLTAVLTCFSTRLPSWGHLGLLVLLMFFIAMMGERAGATFKPLFVFLEELLVPQFEVHQAFDTAPVTWSVVAKYVAVVSGWLLGGVLLFRDREVSYATR